MDNFLEKSSIPEAIATIWKSNPEEKDSKARSALLDFTEADWLGLGFLDLRSFLKIEFKAKGMKKNPNLILIAATGLVQAELSISSTPIKSSQVISLIEYSGYKKFLNLNNTFMQSLSVKRYPIRHDAAKLLLALSFVKYHLDSILFSPADLRNQKMSLLVDEFGYSSECLVSFDKSLR